MKKDRIENTLIYLMELPIENEWVEFKKSKKQFRF